MPPCRNHHERETVRRCAGCGQGLCESCLVPYLGELYCADCRDLRLVAMEANDPDSLYVRICDHLVPVALTLVGCIVGGGLLAATLRLAWFNRLWSGAVGIAVPVLLLICLCYTALQFLMFFEVLPR